MKRLMIWMCLALALPAVSFAHGGIDAAKHSLEATMLVTGEIAINPDGSVYGYSLDSRDKLPPEIVKLIDGTLSGWKFQPVQLAGKAVRAQTRMSLRIVANQVTPGHFIATVEGAAFGNDGQPGLRSSYGDGAEEGLTYLTRTPPEYPRQMLGQRISGTVYVVVEVNRAGRVADAVVRQVNLRQLGDATELKRWRDTFAEATLAAVRTWTFNVPSSGPDASNQKWFATIPVNYALLAQGQKPSPPYTWDAYVPGPVNPLPWQPIDAKTIFDAAIDAIPLDSSRPFVPDTRFLLLASPNGHAAAPQANTRSSSG